MIFCNINQELIEVIKKYADGRAIVDCGCGDGLLGYMMKDSDEHVLSIDIWPKESALIPTIMQMDAADFPFADPYMPVFIRPCHSMQFVDKVMRKHKDNVRNFLYISKPHNLEIDIDLDEFNAEQVEDWTGDEGEKVYLLTKK